MSGGTASSEAVQVTSEPPAALGDQSIVPVPSLQIREHRVAREAPRTRA